VAGAYRYLQRAWRLVNRVQTLSVSGSDNMEHVKALRRTIHTGIQRVTHAFENDFAFNVAIAALMELSNALQSFEVKGEAGVAALREGAGVLVTMLAPFVPHFACECGQRLGVETPSILASWPRWMRRCWCPKK